MTTAKATRREWIGLAAIALPCLVYSMDLSVLNLAVPQLTADLRPSASQLLWIVDIYGFLIAGFLITMGTLGDRIGRRRLLMIGAAAFAVASVLAAFATTAPMLIAARAVMGISAATLAPSTLSLIRNMFLDDRERQVAIGLWIGCFSAGAAIGPVVGGVMLQYFWWGSVFLIGVPVMLMLLVVGPMLLPEFKDPNAGRLDLASALLSIAAVLTIIFGIKRVAEHGFDAAAIVAIVVGLALGTAFARRQYRLPEPLIDLALFRSPVIASSLTINVGALFIAFGYGFFMAQYLQLVLGMQPLQAGLWSVPAGITFIIGSVTTPLLARRFEPRPIIVGSFIVTAAGFFVLSLISESAHEFAVLMIGYLIVCAGLSPIGMITTDLVMSSAPPEKAGAASGISETSFEFGAAAGIAMLGSLMIALYQAGLARELPAHIQSEGFETLGGAITAAQSMSQADGVLALIAARRAFSASFEFTSTLCGTASIVAAILAAVLLRRSTPTTVEPSLTSP